jgi:hypothetical protein
MSHVKNVKEKDLRFGSAKFTAILTKEGFSSDNLPSRHRWR